MAGISTGIKGGQDFNVFHTHMPATLFGGEVYHLYLPPGKGTLFIVCYFTTFRSDLCPDSFVQTGKEKKKRKSSVACFIL